MANEEPTMGVKEGKKGYFKVIRNTNRGKGYGQESSLFFNRVHIKSFGLIWRDRLVGRYGWMDGDRDR